MIFEWDEKKNKANKLKHRLSFEEARFVFLDPFSVTREDRHEKESRQQIVGQINSVLVILVVYLIREGNNEEIIRIISARKATTAERRRYEAGTWF